MTPFLLLLAAVASPPPDIFETCIAAHSHLSAASVEIRRDSRLNGLNLSSSYSLSYVLPGQLKLRVVEPQEQAKAATRRTYFLSGKQFLALDESANERLSRTVQGSGKLLERMTAITGQLDDAVAVLLSPAALRDFFAHFKGQALWTTTHSGGETRLARQDVVNGKPTSVHFAFDSQTTLLKSVRLESPLTLLVWTYTYKNPPRSIAWSPPAGAKLVSSFTQRKAPPKFADKKAHAALKAAQGAYTRLKAGVILVNSGTDSSTLMIDGRKLREEQSKLAWAYDGKVLTLHDIRGGRWYRGKCSRQEILTYVAGIGGRVNPKMREFILKRNPIDAMLGPELKVRSTGSGTIGGAPCDLIEISGPTIRQSLAIRKTDHLFASATTENLEGKRVVARSDMDFTYVKLGQPGSKAFALSAPKGATVLGLGRLDKK